MKNVSRRLWLFTLPLAAAVSPAFAHSTVPGASTHLSNAASLSGQASAQAVGASGEVGVAAAKTVASGAAAVFWTGGSVVNGSGQIATHSGAAVMKGAEQLWDAATSDPAARPPLARDRSVPPAPAVPRQATLTSATAPRKDPSPGQAFRSSL